MAVYVSSELKTAAEAAGIDLTQLKLQFAWWKADPGRLNECFWFGRDNPYAEPQMPGYGCVLRHAHMFPTADEKTCERWLTIYKRRGEKKSDRALVYVTNADGDHLLLYIFDEPQAHERARVEMGTMRQLSRTAIKFLEGDLQDFHL